MWLDWKRGDSEKLGNTAIVVHRTKAPNIYSGTKTTRCLSWPQRLIWLIQANKIVFHKRSEVYCVVELSLWLSSGLDAIPDSRFKCISYHSNFHAIPIQKIRVLGKYWKIPKIQNTNIQLLGIVNYLFIWKMAPSQWKEFQHFIHVFYKVFEEE